MGNKQLKNSELFLATERGDVRAVKKLLKNGAEANSATEDNLWTPLMIAAYKGHSSIADCLIKAGADVDAKAEDGQTALMFASNFGHSAIIEELLKHSKAIDATDEKGETALFKAAKSGHSYVMQILVKAGADVNVQDKIEGKSPLAWAAEHGPSSIVSMLIKAGALVNAKNHTGQTALICAASKAYSYLEGKELSMGVVPLTAEKSEHSDKLDDENSLTAPIDGKSARSVSGPSSVVQTLITAGADINSKNHDGYTALMVSCWNGHSSVIKQLVEAKADLNVKAEKGQTALMISSSQGHSSIAELLIKHGAETNFADEKGETALVKAALKGNSYITECLLRAGATTGQRDTVYGNTALMWAAAECHVAIVESLIRGGAKVNLKNHKGETALLKAAAKGHSYITECLVNAGADVNATDDARGDCPLILSASEGSDSAVECLLGNGAKVNHKNHEGHTALSCAMKNNRPSTVELLVSAGAEVDAKDALLGKPPLEYATVQNLPALKDAIQRGLATYKSYGFGKFNTLSHSTNTPASTTVGSNTSGIIPTGPGPGGGSSSIVSTSNVTSNSNSLLESSSVTSNSSTSPSVSRQSSLAPTAATRTDSSGSGTLALFSTPLEQWGLEDVGRWLKAIALGQYADAFADASVDGEMLPVLASDRDLLQNECGVSRRIHRIKIIREIKKLIQTHDKRNSLSSSSQDLMGLEREESIEEKRVHYRKDKSVSALNNSNRRSKLVSNENENKVDEEEGGEGTKDIVSDESEIPAELPSPVSFPPPTHSLTGGPGFGVNLQLQYEKIFGPSQPFPVSPSTSETSQLDPSTASLLDVGQDESVETLKNKLLQVRKTLRQQSITSNGSNKDNEEVKTRPSSVQNIRGKGPRLKDNFGGPSGTSFDTSSLSFGGEGGDISSHLQTLDLHHGHHSSEGTHLSSSSSTTSVGVSGDGFLEDDDTDVEVDWERNNDEALGELVGSKNEKKSKIPQPRRIPFAELVLKQEIGRGEFGTVYLATWRGAPVAVKRLHSQNLSPAQMRHFIREAGIMELLGSHPNVIRFCGVCTVPPNLCIVTQYFANGSLEDLLVKRTPKLEFDRCTLLKMARDMACGVLHLHMEGVIHRDLAARNLLVDDNYSIRVADFGMSRIKQASVGHTDSSFGPLKWMSPEAILKQQYSEKSDAYSFGIVLWEILFRKPPYEDIHDLEAALKVAGTASFRPPIPLDFSSPLTQLMHDCWQHDPKDRPNLRQILQRLETIIKDMEKTKNGHSNHNKILTPYDTPLPVFNSQTSMTPSAPPLNPMSSNSNLINNQTSKSPKSISGKSSSPPSVSSSRPSSPPPLMSLSSDTSVSSSSSSSSASSSASSSSLSWSSSSSSSVLSSSSTLASSPTSRLSTSRLSTTLSSASSPYSFLSSSLVSS